MNTTISMWLGILFLVLCIVAVLLQAWLWGPKFWDEEAKRTRAPEAWLRVHAGAGYLYAVIYFVMMWNMVPRLWEYQYELPARTVIHAVVAIIIGVLLITKILILTFFRHFEEAMPRFGFGLLMSTVVLVFLSVPYALRASDLTGETLEAPNLERVGRLLAKVEMEEGSPSLEKLVTPKGLLHGREILARKCTTCHDMRTILVKPRTPQKWFDVSARMVDKPAVFGDQLEHEDIPYVTAYMVAITPDLQKSAKRRRAGNEAQQARTRAMSAAVHEADNFEAPALDDNAAKALTEDKCLECHEIEEIAEHGGDDIAGWRSVVAAMVEEGAEINDEEATQIARYLTKLHGPELVPASEAESEAEAARVAEEAAKVEEARAAAEARAAKEVKDADEAKAATESKAKAKAAAKPEAKPKAKAKAKAKAKPKYDLAKGKALYLKKCKSCHGADGEGQTAYGKKIGSPDLGSWTGSTRSLEKVIREGRSGTKMKAYEGKLTPQEIVDVAAFVKRF
jgi:mono/diheme cytochrome c family protein